MLKMRRAGRFGCAVLVLALLAGLLGGCGGPGAVVELPEERAPLASEPGAVLASTASGSRTQQNSSAVIDYSNAKDGYVMAAWLAGGSPKLKVLIKGPSGVQYQYNLRTDGQYETFPLSDGDGSYSVGVYKNVSGRDYATVLTASLSVELTDEFAPFIRPNQYVNYSEDSEAVKTAAREIEKAGAEDNLDKVQAIYDFVVTSLTYDTDKAQSVKSGYLPDVDAVLSEKKGICFDYAALMAAMLRSQGVPVKLVVGYTGELYHAWLNVWSEEEGWVNNAIFFDGKEWKLMDPTFASSNHQSAQIMQYIGDGSNYTAKYLY